MPQDVVLGNRSIEDNIAFGVTDADCVLVHEAARQAQIHQGIEALPGSYRELVRCRMSVQPGCEAAGG
ncbi:hypothetical protein ACFV1W_33550 [Kitasatospora sp. NPDC059648]|uniref:hypothetical protein n=1 Tax=Kitasatospora sp. NPDC059648 TaxID=3346894 RepID=UPI0036C249E8